MRFHVVRTTLVALFAPLVFAHAQDSSTTRQSRNDPGPWTFSMGLNSMQLNLGTQRPGTRAELVAALGRHWKLGPHVDLRTQAVGGKQFPRALTLNEWNGCAGCEVWSSREYVGATAAFVYSWRRGKAIRPYLSTGAEAMVMRSRNRLEAPCEETNSCEFIDLNWADRVRREPGLGLTLGLGTEVRLRKTNLFIEYSSHAVPVSASPLMPFSIGLRF